VRKGDRDNWHRALEILNCNSVAITGRFERWVARGIREGSGPSVRFRFAQLAADCHGHWVTSALLAAASDESEHFLVRGRCLENLGGRASDFRPRTYRDRKIYKVIRDCLYHRHPNIRFWACFAAWGAQMRSAVARLRELKSDQGLGDMGWTVGYEATEALKSIQGKRAWEKEPPRRKSPYPCPLSL